MYWLVVEKDNPKAIHSRCHSKESAERWIEIYGNSKTFSNRFLKKRSFEIIEPKRKSKNEKV